MGRFGGSSLRRRWCHCRPAGLSRTRARFGFIGCCRRRIDVHRGLQQALRKQSDGSDDDGDKDKLDEISEHDSLWALVWF